MTQSSSANSQQPSRILLNVPYELQHDNASGTGYRECFSSSCAMVAVYHGRLEGGDNAYNKIRGKYGDTTNAQAHIQALRSLGFDARLITKANASWLRKELQAGFPTPVGWLHKGPLSAPSGGGHWSVAIGYNGDSWIHHDPNGEADIVNGGYVNKFGGRQVTYSRRWLRRWEADGASTGWAMLVHPV